METSVPREDDRSITPIFVIGMNRSGTKWLSNEISRHSEIVSVQDDEHTGIMETPMFWSIPDKFDLRHVDEYIGLIELWSETDFFRETGTDKTLFYRIHPRPDNCYDLFRVLMNDYAQRRGKRYWLQKASPSMAVNMLAYYPDARVVLITRELLDNIKSKIGLSQVYNVPRSLLRSIVGFVLEEKILAKIRKDRNALAVSYEDLVFNHDTTLSMIFDHLGIRDGQVENTVAFGRNTSFDDVKHIPQMFSRKESLFIKLLYRLLRTLPLRVLIWCRSVAGENASYLERGVYTRIKSQFKLY